MLTSVFLTIASLGHFTRYTRIDQTYRQHFTGRERILYVSAIADDAEPGRHP
jgi:hypothetical protein